MLLWFLKREVLFSLDYIFDDRFNAIMDYDLTLRMALESEYDFVNEVLCKRRMGSGITYKSGSRVKFLKEKIVMFEIYEKRFKKIMDYYRNDVHKAKSDLFRHIAFDEWDKGNLEEARSLLLNYKNYFFNRIAYLGTWMFPSYRDFNNFYQKNYFSSKNFN